MVPTVTFVTLYGMVHGDHASLGCRYHMDIWESDPSWDQGLDEDLLLVL